MSIIDEYFLNPILSNGWFNPLNTVVYGIILIVAVYFVFKLLRRMKIKIDRHFLYAILPFIFWGSSTRVLHDAAFSGALTGSLGEFYNLPVFPTPGSYFITFTLAIIVLFISLGIQKYLKYPYWKVMAGTGIVLGVINVLMFPSADLYPRALIGGVTLAWTGLFFGLTYIGERYDLRRIRQLFSLENSGILSVHMLDATSTWAALSFFGYLEQHVLPRFLIDLVGPWAMFPLKLAVLIPVLYVIDRYTEPGDFRNFLKIVIIILGLAPGLRDLLRLVVGV
jgi:uncharacterized membrane protein